MSGSFVLPPGIAVPAANTRPMMYDARPALWHHTRAAHWATSAATGECLATSVSTTAYCKIVLQKLLVRSPWFCLLIGKFSAQRNLSTERLLSTLRGRHKIGAAPVRSSRICCDARPPLNHALCWPTRIACPRAYRRWATELAGFALQRQGRLEAGILIGEATSLISPLRTVGGRRGRGRPGGAIKWTSPTLRASYRPCGPARLI